MGSEMCIRDSIPIVTETISPENKDVAFTRKPVSEVNQLIIDDLTTAVNGLDNNSRFRASKAAAQGLLAKTLIGIGNYLEAQQLCESIVGSGNYSLQSNFKDIFYNEGNSEILFAVGFIPDSEESQNFSSEWLNAVGRTSGVNYLTNDVKEALDAFGGDRTMYSYLSLIHI